MENTTEQVPTALAAQGAEIAQGAELHATIALGTNTAVNIRLDVAALLAALAALGNGREQLKNLRLAKGALELQSRRFLMGGRDRFKPLLGYIYNTNWDPTGLISSLEIPRGEMHLLPLLSSFQSYLSTRPALEDSDKGITAAAAEQLYNDLDDANGAVNNQETVVTNLLRARDTKAKKLRLRIRGTIATLAQELDPLDARWEAFGLNLPGRKSRPDRPGKVSVIVRDNTSAALKWKRAARAEYYRIWKKVNGVDLGMVVVRSRADLDFTLENLPPASVIEIAISAVNNGGESLLSEVVIVTTV